MRHRSRGLLHDQRPQEKGLLTPQPGEHESHRVSIAGFWIILLVQYLCDAVQELVELPESVLAQTGCVSSDRQVPRRSLEHEVPAIHGRTVIPRCQPEKRFT